MRVIVATSLIAGMISCGVTEGVEDHRDTSILVPQGVVRGGPNFRISAVGATDDCSIYVAGSRWGSLVRLDNFGHAVALPSPRRRRDSRIDPGGHGGLTLTYRLVDGATVAASVNRVGDILFYPSGSTVTGPPVHISERRYVAATFGPRRRDTRDAANASAPLLRVFGRDGEALGSRGLLDAQDGWLMNRAVVGARGDTVVVVSLYDGVMHVYDLGPEVRDTTALWVRRLPTYVPYARARETVDHDIPWIESGGTLRTYDELPQLHDAVVAYPFVYALQTRTAQRRPRRWMRPWGPWMWHVTARSLEVYDLQGRSLASHAVPLAARRVAGDANGRVMALMSDSLIVVYGLVDADAGCAVVRGRLLISDMPP